MYNENVYPDGRSLVSHTELSLNWKRSVCIMSYLTGPKTMVLHLTSNLECFPLIWAYKCDLILFGNMKKTEVRFGWIWVGGENFSTTLYYTTIIYWGLHISLWTILQTWTISFNVNKHIFQVISILIKG